MASLSSVSDSDLLARMPALVLAERAAVAEVIEHLMEIDRRRLYLDQACSSLQRYCMERLGYSEDGAMKRMRVARVAQKLPVVLEELRSGAIHLTGLFLLSAHLTEQNAEQLLSAARGQSRREIEKLLARWFPRPDSGSRIEPMLALGSGSPNLTPAMTSSTPDPGATCPATGRRPVDTCLETGNSLGSEWARSKLGPVDTCPGPHRPGNSVGSVAARSKLEPLSASSYRIEFTASAELYAKLERARELLSHTVPRGELATVIERALDALVEGELRRRIGAGKPEQKGRRLKPGSRHVPREVARIVWERDGGQCTFVDAEGRRCSERRYLTLEHRHPWSLGGPPTTDNICLLCNSHNAHAARQVFGEEFLAKKRSERENSLEHESSLESSAGHDSSSEPTRSTNSPQFARLLHTSKPALSAEHESSPEPAAFMESTGPALAAPLMNKASPPNSPQRVTAGDTAARDSQSDDMRTDRAAPSQRPDIYGKLTSILCEWGFRKRQVAGALSELRARKVAPELEPLLRAALTVLVPA